jgi:tyrosyl-tRNA synthetase
MVKEILEKIEKGGNPRDAKMRLAKEIVSIYHGEAKAVSAEEDFINTFQKGGVPENIPEVKIEKSEMEALELLQKCFEGGDKSNSDIRRLFDQGAINLNDEKIADIHKQVTVKAGDIVKAGKKTWFKLVK